MDKDYLDFLQKDALWLPGKENIFRAFSRPLNETRYILLGESPYPRAESANGFAFWDASVKDLWTSNGMSKNVNRATSLRNFLKMLMVSADYLDQDKIGQNDIAALDKAQWVQSLDQLFNNMIHKGLLLLNASLVFRLNKVSADRRLWEPFIESIFQQLGQHKQLKSILLFGNNARRFEQSCNNLGYNLLIAEHPYNISFIHNKKVLNFFKSFNLLSNHDRL